MGREGHLGLRLLFLFWFAGFFSRCAGASEGIATSVSVIVLLAGFVVPRGTRVLAYVVEGSRGSVRQGFVCAAWQAGAKPTLAG